MVLKSSSSVISSSFGTLHADLRYSRFSSARRNDSAVLTECSNAIIKINTSICGALNIKILLKMFFIHQRNNFVSFYKKKMTALSFR